MTNWTTTDEIRHVQGLGRWGGRQKNRFHHLEQYHNAMALRTDWGRVAPGAVRQAVLKELMHQFILWPGAVHTRSYLLRIIILEDNNDT